MAIYGNQNTNTTTPAQTQPRIDYTNLTYKGEKYPDLETMVTRIAKDRANADFKVMRVVARILNPKLKDDEIANALIQGHKTYILDWYHEKEIQRKLFGD